VAAENYGCIKNHIINLHKAFVRLSVIKKDIIKFWKSLALDLDLKTLCKPLEKTDRIFMEVRGQTIRTVL